MYRFHVKRMRSILHLPIQHLLFRKVVRVSTKDQEPAVVPGRVVTDILAKQSLDSLDLALVPQVEAANQPLAVAPDVVVLRILSQHAGYELLLAGRVSQVVDDGLAVVPDLVVLEVLEGGGVEPVELFAEVFTEGEHDLGAVQPVGVGSASDGGVGFTGVGDAPDSVVGRVVVDDVLGQVQSAVAHLVLGHDGAQVAHGLFIFLWVCDGSQGVGAALVQRDGLDVLPLV